MRFLSASGLFLRLAAAKVSYEGYKAFRIDAHDGYDAVESAISNLEFVSLSCVNNHKTLEVAIAPNSLRAFEDLNLSTSVLSEDLGAELEAEDDLEPYEGSSYVHLLFRCS